MVHLGRRSEGKTERGQSDRAGPNQRGLLKNRRFAFSFRAGNKAEGEEEDKKRRDKHL